MQNLSFYDNQLNWDSHDFSQSQGLRKLKTQNVASLLIFKSKRYFPRFTTYQQNIRPLEHFTIPVLQRSAKVPSQIPQNPTIH